jgi:hypothetical protein
MRTARITGFLQGVGFVVFCFEAAWGWTALPRPAPDALSAIQEAIMVSVPSLAAPLCLIAFLSSLRA